ncbi:MULTISPECIES: zinc-binding dehydrogenase [Streptomyces]|uniref:Zinc-binding dehydrogenase n=1 Tax=Streptomyces doudnae TaxID=3075536 RepID=A0ABD5EUY9_9ACTN|nr:MULTISPECIES: zinc-binding dehydrogenase [unclassified Streptomyces]MDT0437439.1 zinc-binding dehydrogenase [Streptomyces sp. DSM 41981]MYQ67005.1 zinc-binding dehydrogenase [Streptomyces sp. SID4950]SCE28651.1 NADPH:quinone reductase [Streptomyces sp. SolWspMP-5a-2]
MRAIVIQRYGDPGGLAVVDVPVPVPGPGQVRIVTEAIGVGGADTLIRSGALAAYGFTEGHVPGSEVAGTVDAVGAGVDPALTGRRVWGFTGTGGGCTERALASAADVLPLPPGLSAVDAVTLGGSGAVAHFGLAHARFAPGDAVLVRGAAGGIGVMAVQLAARGGASAVAVTTSSAERGERLRALGATVVLDRAGEGGPETPAGYDVVLDIVAGDGLPSFLDRLRPGGRLVAVGAVGGQPPADFGTRLMAAFRSSLSFATFSLDTVSPADRRAVRSAQFAAAVRGELTAVVHEVLPLTEAARAHRAMDAGEVFGRVVLVP